jgi:spermidine synthase
MDARMYGIRDGWFYERDSFWPGQAIALQVEEILYEGKSEFQEILVFRSKRFGNVLVLDGIIQCTDVDESSYQEMISHVPLFSHPNPRKVLVIGGGDGGVIREIDKHPEVEQVVQCEIDKVKFHSVDFTSFTITMLAKLVILVSLYVFYFVQ